MAEPAEAPHEESSETRDVPIYPVKRIGYFGRVVPILCQNQNGPCPLLAICNVLLLRGETSISPDCEYITEDNLIQVVANKILESNSKADVPEVQMNQQQLIDDAVSILHKLTRGIDVNVTFSDPQGFEYTQELTPFDLTGIRLLHGWLVDPEDVEAQQVIDGSSYNTLVQTLVDSSSPRAKRPRNESEPDSNSSIQDIVKKEVTAIVDKVVERLAENQGEARSNVGQSGQEDEQGYNLDYRASVIRRFLDETATQLTYHGIVRLYETMNDRELGILFRNNHFSIIFKYDGYLYLLVTDEGYRDEEQVVWEVLDEIAGDTVLVNEHFKLPAIQQGTGNQAPASHEQSSTHGTDPEPHPQPSGGATSTYEELLQAQMELENNPDAMQNQGRSEPTQAPVPAPKPKPTRHYKSNRERYGAQAETLRQAHEARRLRQQQEASQRAPQQGNQQQSRIVKDEEGRLRTADGRLLTDEECARVYQKLEQNNQRRSQEPPRREKKKSCAVM